VKTRKPRNAALEFAKGFTVLVAREALRQGRKRVLNPAKFEKWARSAIRSGGGDPDRIGEAVGRRLHWMVFPQKAKWQQDVEYCIRRGRSFARRHKVLIAEQVLTGDAERTQLEMAAEEMVRILGPKKVLDLLGKGKESRACASRSRKRSRISRRR
jgi:hypothetical protein